MAITIDKLAWIYPPNWDEVYPHDGKGDFHREGLKRGILHFSHYWGATENFASQQLLDISALRGPTGQQVMRTVIEKIEWVCYGVNALLYWERPFDHAGSIVYPIAHFGADTLHGQGVINGPLLDPGEGTGSPIDSTGDILLTTVDGASKDFLDMKIHIKFKESARPHRADPV